MIIVSVMLVLDVENGAEAADAVNEILREEQRTYAASSSLVDYAIQSPALPVHFMSNLYEEGDAFMQI